MKSYNQFLLVFSLVCFFMLSSCTGEKKEKSELAQGQEVSGEKLELPYQEWVSITSTKEPCKIQYYYHEGDVFKFLCTKQSPGEEEMSSRQEGKIGSMRSCGRTAYYPQTSKVEDILFFYFEIVSFDSDSNTVTVVVYHPEQF